MLRMNVVFELLCFVVFLLIGVFLVFNPPQFVPPPHQQLPIPREPEGPRLDPQRFNQMPVDPVRIDVPALLDPWLEKDNDRIDNLLAEMKAYQPFLSQLERFPEWRPNEREVTGVIAVALLNTGKARPRVQQMLYEMRDRVVAAALSQRLDQVAAFPGMLGTIAEREAKDEALAEELAILSKELREAEKNLSEALQALGKDQAANLPLRLTVLKHEVVHMTTRLHQGKMRLDFNRTLTARLSGKQAAPTRTAKLLSDPLEGEIR